MSLSVRLLSSLDLPFLSVFLSFCLSIFISFCLCSSRWTTHQIQYFQPNYLGSQTFNSKFLRENLTLASRFLMELKSLLSGEVRCKDGESPSITVEMHTWLQGGGMDWIGPQKYLLSISVFPQLYSAGTLGTCMILLFFIFLAVGGSFRAV